MENISSNIMEDYTSYNLILDATHSQMKMRLAEIKFDKRWTVLQCKEQL